MTHLQPHLDSPMTPLLIFPPSQANAANAADVEELDMAATGANAGFAHEAGGSHLQLFPVDAELAKVSARARKSCAALERIRISGSHDASGYGVPLRLPPPAPAVPDRRLAPSFSARNP